LVIAERAAAGQDGGMADFQSVDEYIASFPAEVQEILEQVRATPELSAELATAIEPYLAGKSTLKFPLTKPIPYDLIARLAEAFVASRTAESSDR
jgi:uncharacterized protein YdhG (YjbR/CyaY superfamily)